MWLTAWSHKCWVGVTKGATSDRVDGGDATAGVWAGLSWTGSFTGRTPHVALYPWGRSPNNSMSLNICATLTTWFRYVTLVLCIHHSWCQSAALVVAGCRNGTGNVVPHGRPPWVEVQWEHSSLPALSRKCFVSPCCLWSFKDFHNLPLLFRKKIEREKFAVVIYQTSCSEDTTQEHNVHHP